MAYVKTTWQTGDVITAEKLNNMEGGIEALSISAPIFFQTDADGIVIGATGKQIYALAQIAPVAIILEEHGHEIDYLRGFDYDEADGYSFHFGDRAYVSAGDDDPVIPDTI